MTNGENILSAFSNATIRRCKNKDFTYIEVEQNDKWIADFDMEWWNAEYKEPTTKNDLGVDAVSRKAVLNQIFYSTDNSGDVVLGSALRERIERLPSVTPQEPKTGYWKLVSDGYGDKAYICECSECKDTVWVYKNADRKWNYCANCGAKMVEPQESEDNK